MNIHVPVTLRGCNLIPAIDFGEGGILRFAPHWGLCRESYALAVIHTAESAHVDYKVLVRRGSPPVIYQAPGAHDAARELVLLQEYRPGVGAKRWPSFFVHCGSSVIVLSTAQTSGGSGYEKWSLLSAPLGWAAEVAARFGPLNYRDGPSIVIDMSDF